MFDNIREDWRAHKSQWNRHGFWALAVYRFGRWRYSIEPRALRAPFSFLYRFIKFFTDPFLGVEMPSETVIGKRLVFEHVGGIVISGDAILGDDCILRNGVTIGLRHQLQRGSPHIGHRVDIGTGAKLLGSIRIGNDVAIGANAVVLCDVPDDCSAVGIPARVISRRSKAGTHPAPTHDIAETAKTGTTDR